MVFLLILAQIVMLALWYTVLGTIPALLVFVPLILIAVYVVMYAVTVVMLLLLAAKVG